MKTPEQIAQEIISKVETELQEESKEIQSSTAKSKASSARDSMPTPEMPEVKGEVDEGTGDAKSKRTSNTGKYKGSTEKTNTSPDEVGIDIVDENDTDYSHTDENDGLTDRDNETGLEESIVSLLSTPEMRANIQEHVAKLFASESGTLTEEFTAQASTIFESAVMERSLVVAKMILEEQTNVVGAYIEQLKEEAQAHKDQIVDSIDQYLTHVAEEWMQENELQVETGLREEISSEFIEGLKTLFAEHYIDVPDEKYDVLGEMNSRLEKLEEDYNNSLKVQSILSEELRKEKRSRILNESAKNLTESEKEKLSRMAEGISATDEKEFAKKVEILTESYFTPTPVDAQKTEKAEVLTEEKKNILSSDPAVNNLVRQMSRFAPSKD